jgi:hypothetical protein
MENQVLDTTHKHIPAKTIVMPNAVSFVINFPSANHSPSTVKRKASEFVIGTVNDSSVGKGISAAVQELQSRGRARFSRRALENA